MPILFFFESPSEPNDAHVVGLYQLLVNSKGYATYVPNRFFFTETVLEDKEFNLNMTLMI